VRTETVMGVVGGVIVGYVLWLVAYSIGKATSTLSVWGPIVLVLSAALAVWALLWGRRQLERRNYVLASFVFALPALPVLLSVLVLVDSYL
jgi:heme O synthase-like polyprenyltransferase